MSPVSHVSNHFMQFSSRQPSSQPTLKPIISQAPGTISPTGPPSSNTSSKPSEEPSSFQPTDERHECPESNLIVNIITDGFPAETSWTLQNMCNDTLEASIASKTLYTSSDTPYSITWCVSHAAFEFTINDSFGDGICCKWGQGSYSVRRE